MNEIPPRGAGGMRFFGWVSITVGCAIMLLCGSCTAYWGGFSAADIVNCRLHPASFASCQAAHGLAPSLLVLSLAIGGPPTLLGLFMVIFGIVMQRRRRAAAAPGGPATQVWSSKP